MRYLKVSRSLLWKMFKSVLKFPSFKKSVLKFVLKFSLEIIQKCPEVCPEVSKSKKKVSRSLVWRSFKSVLKFSRSIQWIY